MYVKMKELGPVGGGGRAPARPPRSAYGFMYIIPNRKGLCSVVDMYANLFGAYIVHDFRHRFMFNPQTKFGLNNR